MTGKIATGARQLFQSARELDERYQIKESVGSAALTGLDSLASAAKRAGVALDEKRQQIDARSRSE